MERVDGSADVDVRPLELWEAATLPGNVVLARLGSSTHGLTSAEASRRLDRDGPNAVRSHGAHVFDVLLRQVRGPLLLLLIAAALVALAVGQRTDAIIILAIVSLSVGLGFFNEYRSEKAVEELHARIRHAAVTKREGRAGPVDVTNLVPGDVIRLEVGDVVPADVRLLEVNGLECDEAVLTGESMPAPKSAEPVEDPESPLALASCAFMGTVVRAGTGWAVVVRTGARTEFGRIAVRLGERSTVTAFQLGLRSFSYLLVRVTVVLTVSIFVINTVLGRSLLDSGLFALAIAVGLTPQLLPAIVTISLSAGARRLARRQVVVKRLVSIEDLGNIEVLFTDKTGTLTEGSVRFSAALDVDGADSSEVLRFGLLCNEAVGEEGVAVGGNQLDRALWEAAYAQRMNANGHRRVAELPFDFERRLMSVIVADGDGHRLQVTKGAPEAVLERCSDVGDSAKALLDREFAAGGRVVAVATKEGVDAIEERDLRLVGFLVFLDPPKADAAGSLERLADLQITVKIVTGDNPRVAEKVWRDLGLPIGETLTGGALDAMTDGELAKSLDRTTIFARVTPEQKSRIIRVQRSLKVDAGFLGDGVNDAVALHEADVGISVESATDVAKDAADIVLVTKDLGILADGVVEGRRIFANTIKYVLMGTSSNFGNMFSAAGASLFLKFLPMLPTQILVNNLLYDVSEMTIPTDDVDPELLERPARWDTLFIRRFMMVFGPISSAYDFLTFGVMLWVFHAGAREFHTAWFVESLSTQSLVIFVIRTRRFPFWKSRPSLPLLLSTLACAGVGIALPYSPLAHVLGFTPLPWTFMAILAAMVATYLTLAQLGVARFFRPIEGAPPLARRVERVRRIHRRATRWSRLELTNGSKGVGRRRPWRGSGHQPHEETAG